MAKYVFPAVFTPEDIGGYSINFPDLPSCYTQGDDLKDGYKMAEDVASAVLVDLENEHKAIPAPSDPVSLHLEPGEFIALIGADTLAYRQATDNRAVKKTLSIPHWLNVLAERESVNFSQTLQEALTTRLGVV